VALPIFAVIHLIAGWLGSLLIMLYGYLKTNPHGKCERKNASRTNGQKSSAHYECINL